MFELKSHRKEFRVVKEVWRSVTIHSVFAYDGRYRYEVSNLGGFRKAAYMGHKCWFEAQVLTPRSRRSSEQLWVRLCDLGHSYNEPLSKLVAMAFCKRPEGADTVIHKDGNVRNNIWTNLQWVCSKKEEKAS